MKQAFYTLTTSLLITLATQTTNGSVLLFDDFDGGGIGVGDTGSNSSVNGGFQLVSNSSAQGTGTIGETSSNATIETDSGGGFDNSGIVSVNSFDASAAPNLSATWVVASQSPAGGNSAINTEFLLQGGTGFREQSFIRFGIGDDGTWVFDGNNGSTATFSGGPALSGITDGYTLTLDLDASGWEITTTGLDTNLSETGAWTAGFDFTDLQTDLHVAAMIQRDDDANSPIVSNIDSISVSIIPEPSTCVLLTGLLSLSSLVRRRRSKNQ